MAHLFPFIDYDCAGLAIKLGDMKNMSNHRLREGTSGSPKIIPQSYLHATKILPPKAAATGRFSPNKSLGITSVVWCFYWKWGIPPKFSSISEGKNMVIRWFPDFYNFLPPNFCNKFQRPGGRWDDQNVRFWWWWPGEIRCNFQGISDLLCNIVLSTYIDHVYYI